MALVYVDEEEPLCISGDGGGGIFVWGIAAPFTQDPLRKWYEQKDWRFSGIHSLAVFRNLFLYTGSGDRTIKAWSLKVSVIFIVYSCCSLRQKLHGKVHSLGCCTYYIFTFFQDGTLMCTMSGHKSVVSTLSVCDEVLYSGSWDGTIRLWSLNDHSPLTVLGEDMLGEMKSILAITANRHLLVAAYENGCIKVSCFSRIVFFPCKRLMNCSPLEMNIHWSPYNHLLALLGNIIFVFCLFLGLEKWCVHEYQNIAQWCHFCDEYAGKMSLYRRLGQKC